MLPADTIAEITTNLATLHLEPTTATASPVLLSAVSARWARHHDWSDNPWVFLMRGFLLAGVVALSMFTASIAHAIDKTLPPTDPLIGSWCSKKADSKKAGYTIYTRGPCYDDLTISRDGYSRHGGTSAACEFLEVKRIPNGIEAHSECSYEEQVAYFFEKVTFQVFGNQLRERVIASSGHIEMGETFCVSVKATPDGFLNLREGPGMKFRVKAKLNIGDHLEANAPYKEWTRVFDKTNGVSGWVYSRYIEKLSDCYREPSD
jgi:hypothetical protein